MQRSPASRQSAGDVHMVHDCSYFGKVAHGYLYFYYVYKVGPDGLVCIYFTRTS